MVGPLQLGAKSLTMKLKNVPLTGVELLPCDIMGAPKPKTSPHYPEFQVFQHMDKLQESEQCITAWLLGIFFCRQISISTDNETQTMDQPTTSVATTAVTQSSISAETLTHRRWSGQPPATQLQR